jgi:AcrR family transcriptional regulator
MAEDAASGLRERKKLRTRATLIEAAAELCLRQGFDNTTVDQIAAAADVSPRTFSRYFPTKDAVIAAIADEIDTYIATALEKQPTDITEYEALLRAHLEVFGPDEAYETPGFKRMAVMIQIVNGSTSIKASALAHEQGLSTNAVLSARMGVSHDDPAICIITDVWTVLFATSFAGLGQPGHEPIGAKVVCERLCTSVELFGRTWSPWTRGQTDDGQPPASAPSR